MITDDALMLEVKDGRVERLAILFERHHLQLFNFFLRLTANRPLSEDLVQEVFVRLLKYRSTYRGQDKFVFWMYRIAHNVHIDHLRRRKEAYALDEQFHEVASQEPAVEEKLAHSQETAMMSRALSLLPQDKKKVLVLSRFQNLKYREIAELLDCPIGTVKALVHRAVKDLGEIYARMVKETCRHEV
jgi:RNA polymerase sigma factor (sigma-70 family)